NIDDNDPQAAVKWMWNHEQKTPYTDNVGCGWNVELVNAKGERERFFGSNFWRRMMWRGRLVVGPKPGGAHGPADRLHRAVGPAARSERSEGRRRSQLPLRLSGRSRRFVPLPAGVAESAPSVDGEPLRRVLGHGHRHRLDLDLELQALLLDVQVSR